MKKYLIYLLAVILLGCNTGSEPGTSGGFGSGPGPDMNQAMIQAFSNMTGDKNFSTPGGVVFSESGGTTFAFTDQRSNTFSGSECSPIESTVKINDFPVSFDPAKCWIQNVAYYDYRGNYFDMGTYYFISTNRSDKKGYLTFAFQGGAPKSGMRELGYSSFGLYSFGIYFKQDGMGTGSDGNPTGISYGLYGPINIVNNEGGVHINSVSYGYLQADSDLISLSIGGCIQ
jgi:hypothetical protein